MRILRLRLRNFRGVESAEVRFAPVGVTVVQGPNEAGKSSLAEAIHVLFEHLDSTTRKDVKALKPVHRDEGAEIEADVESGPYAFTYFKRFHKKPETWLRIERPKPENLTGREAHERAEAILGETIDVALWKALQFEQGGELAPPNLAGQTRLSVALDAAAGSAKAGQREETLLEAVREEYLRYYTDGGQERKDLREQDARLADEQKKRDELEAKLRALEADVQRSAQLRREIAQLGEDEQRLRLSLQQHDEKLASLSRLESELGQAQANVAHAALQARNAAEAVERRQQLARELEARAASHAELVAQLDLTDPERAQAARELASAEEEAVRAKAAHDAAAALLVLRQKDRTFRHEELDLEQLVEREARVERALADVVAAEKVLAGPKVDDRALAAMQEAQLEVERARAGLAAGSPRVRVTARGPIEPLVDGTAKKLRAGETHEVVVEKPLVLDLPGVAEVQVRPGGSAEELRAALEEAERALAQRLSSAGVNDVAHAVKVRDDRREASRIVKERRTAVAESLRDLSPEQLRAKVADLRERVGSYPARRESQVPLPADFAEAKKLEAAAEADAQQARREADAALARREQARARSKDLDVAHAQSQARVEQATTAIAEARERLERERGAASDAVLESARDAASRDAQAKERAREETATRLAAASPEETKTLAANARRAEEDARKRLDEAKGELGRVTGRLQVSGEEGLAEARDAAITTCNRLADEIARTRARAEAAKLLNDTLVAARQEAHAGYVAPLREQIEGLGRIVFGPTFRVDLDDALAVTSRTLDGVTVPFEGLSGGTKEQIGILARLACAILVAKEGGAPVVLDDALGYTDADRLERMGAVLARAGESCQVIVLTCVPERYRQVGGARVVRLGTDEG